MHIVFLCDNTTRYMDANLTLCRNLAKEFCARGHSVSFLGNCENPQDPIEETVDGMPYYRFYYPINRITHEILERYNQSHSLLQMAVDLLRHPVTAVVDVVRAATGYNPIERNYVRLLEAVHKKHPVDLAIASSGSFYTIHALAKSSVKCIRFGYMMDPYWKNHAMGGPRAEREELFAWKRLDRMIIPVLLESDYSAPQFAPYRNKRIPVEFPGIADHVPGENPVIFDLGKRNLLFAGNFYETIRSPEYLLRLADVLPDNVCVHILGGIYGCFRPDVMGMIERLQESGKLMLHGSVSAEQARGAMHAADCLINLGNAIANQLPSKIFEYFSTGKPVIHIQKIPDCPCKDYMERYGNAIVLYEWDILSENAEKAAAFLREKSEVLPFETVHSRFAECTIPYVADQILCAEYEN